MTSKPSLIIYLRVTYHYVFCLFIVRPALRIVALISGHRTRFVKRAKIIGDEDFIRYTEEFSQSLQSMDATMYEEVFIKNQFIFIQYSDVKYANNLLSEYAIPGHFQRKKAKGIGAFIIYAFFCNKLGGKSLESSVRFSLESRKNYDLAREKSYAWLIHNQFPDTICEWFEPKK